MLDHNDIQQRMGRVEGALISLGAASEIRADFRHIIEQFEVDEGNNRLDKLLADTIGSKIPGGNPNKSNIDLPLPPAPASQSRSKPKSPEHKKKISDTMLAQHARKRGDVIVGVDQ